MTVIKIFKKISFLGKKKLIWRGQNKKDFSIAIYKSKGQNPYIEIDFLFENLNDDFNDFAVSFEYYQTGYSKTIELDVVKNLRNQKKKIELTDISYELLKCSIKITNPIDGKIEAFADRIKPDFIDDDNDDAKVSTKNYNTASWIRWRTKPMDSPWKIDIQANEKPICWLNSNIQLKQNLHNSNIHKALIHPVIFREVLIKYIASNEIDDNDIWKKKIYEIAENILVPMPTNDVHDKILYENEIDKWVEDVTDAYAKKHSFVEKYKQEKDE